MDEKEQLHKLIDQLPESEVAAAARFLRLLNTRKAGDECPPQTLAGDLPAPPPVTFREFERKLIEGTLRANGGNRTRTARQLGISLRTVQYRLKEYQETNTLVGLTESALNPNCTPGDSEHQIQPEPTRG